MNEVMELSLLHDFYGNLLSDRQRDVLNLYHEENLSLAEIAEEFGISRQGVYDALKNGEKALRQYEEKLGLVEKFEKSHKVIETTDEIIDELLEEQKDNAALTKKLKKIKKEIDTLD